MTEIAPSVADNGDIYLHGQDELSFRLQFDGEDDIDTRAFFLIIDGTDVRRQLQASGNDSVIVTLLQADLAQIPTTGALYVIRDETAHPFNVRLDGRIRWRGWN